MDWLESFPEGVSLPPPLLPAPPHPPSRAQQHFVYPAYADASSSAQLWHLSQAYACAQPAWHAPWAPFDPYAPVAGPACADSTVAHHPGPSKADEQTAPPYADDEDDPFSFFDRVDAIRAEEEERGDAAAEESNAESGLAFEGAGQDAEKSIGDSMGRTAESQAGEFEKENRNSQEHVEHGNGGGGDGAAPRCAGVDASTHDRCVPSTAGGKPSPAPLSERQNELDNRSTATEADAAVDKATPAGLRSTKQRSLAPPRRQSAKAADKSVAAPSPVSDLPAKVPQARLKRGALVVDSSSSDEAHAAAAHARLKRRTRVARTSRALEIESDDSTGQPVGPEDGSESDEEPPVFSSDRERRRQIREGKRRAITPAESEDDENLDIVNAIPADFGAPGGKNGNSKTLAKTDLTGGRDEVDAALSRELLDSVQVKAMDLEYDMGEPDDGYQDAINNLVGASVFANDKIDAAVPLDKADFSFIRPRGNPPAEDRPTLLFNRASGPRSARSWMQNAKSTFPIAVHVRKTFLGADGASDKNGRVPPDQDPKNIALFFKSSTANKDPTRWRDGPPPIRDEYNGREFVRRMQDKRRPASSAIIVGVAGLTTLPESWLKILKHVKRDFRLFFSLQMGRFVCEINIAKFKAALRGKKKSSDEFHIRLVAEMTGQRLNRQKRGKLNKELGSELNRQPRRKKYDYDADGQRLCETGCGRRARTEYGGTKCPECGTAVRCAHLTKNGKACTNLAVADNKTRCQTHRSKTRSCTGCGVKQAHLHPGLKCWKCMPQSYRDEHYEKAQKREQAKGMPVRKPTAHGKKAPVKRRARGKKMTGHKRVSITSSSDSDASLPPPLAKKRRTSTRDMRTDTSADEPAPSSDSKVAHDLLEHGEEADRVLKEGARLIARMKALANGEDVTLSDEEEDRLASASDDEDDLALALDDDDDLLSDRGPELVDEVASDAEGNVSLGEADISLDEEDDADISLDEEDEADISLDQEDEGNISLDEEEEGDVSLDEEDEDAMLDEGGILDEEGNDGGEGKEVALDAGGAASAGDEEDEEDELASSDDEFIIIDKQRTRAATDGDDVEPSSGARSSLRTRSSPAGILVLSSDDSDSSGDGDGV